MQLYKLLVDQNKHVLNPIMEQANRDEERKLYIEGIFGEAAAINQNGRLYQQEEFEKEIERYNKEFVQEGRAFNELEHPTTTTIDLERTVDRTVSLRMEGNKVIGKAIILDTPKGRIEKAIIEGGGRIGKSSRALGQIKETKDKSGDYDLVSDMHLICFDTVADPSVATAIVDPILEQKNWIIGKDGEFLEASFDKLEEDVKNLKKDKETILTEAILSFIKSLNN